MKESLKLHREDRGFTLIELMITLVLTSIAFAAIYSVFRVQQKAYTAQDQVVLMQQNLRAAIGLMTRDLRMAGYNPLPVNAQPVDIYFAAADGIAFSIDWNEDGSVDDPGEHIAYDLFNMNKADGDSVSVLGRSSANATIAGGAPAEGGHFAGHIPLAENIERIEFWYELADGTRTLAPSATEMDDIVAVDLSILAIAPQRDANFTTTRTIFSASNADWTGTSQTDGFRRRFFIQRIELRNLGT